MASLWIEIRRRARWALPQLLGLALCVYFAYHLIQGDRGIRSYMRLTEELADARVTEAAIAAEVAAAQARVAALSTGSLDPDMLEERARLLLNFGHPEDYVIFLPSEQ